MDKIDQPSKKPIVLIGGGGHCRSIVDVLKMLNCWTIRGVVEKNHQFPIQQTLLPILGYDENLQYILNSNDHVLITIGHLGSAHVRAKIWHSLDQITNNKPTIISPLSYVCSDARIGPGSVVMHRSTILTGARVGINSIVNTGALLEHDVTVGDNCHIATHCVINGGCTIGFNTFIGSNAVVVHGVNIAENIIIGAGSVVTQDLQHPGTYIGCPARLTKHATH